MATTVSTTGLGVGIDRLVELQRAELPQKDELCGAFWVTLALRLGGLDVDQDAVGEAAGSVLSRDGGHELLPAGETGRRDYRLGLPVIEDASRSGTAPTGLVRAVAELTGGARVAVPLTGPWSAATVAAVLAMAAEAQAVTIANLATRHFWGSRPTASQLLAYLVGGELAGPPPDWDVGHYVALLGSVAGPRGTLVIVGDSYPSLGLGGVYAQPIEAVAAGLGRQGTAAGGILVVAAADRHEQIVAAAAAAAIDVGAWDNGSPDARDG